MHKKAQITKDETLTVAARSNGVEKIERRGQPIEILEAEQEEKFLKETMEAYSYWRKQPGQRAKDYAEAYRLLLHSFTKIEDKE